jgi:hypothetical protein
MSELRRAALERARKRIARAPKAARDPRINAADALLEAVVHVLDVEHDVVEWNGSTCPNCDAPTDERKKIFCGELCRQEAELIRYVRRSVLDGRLDDDDVVRDGIGSRVLMVRAGGYPAARKVPASLRAAIIERDGGICQICGAPGNEIDHISGDANAPENLQLLCKTCNGAKLAAAVKTITLESDPVLWHFIVQQQERLGARIASPHPLRICDREQSWESDWRSYLRRAAGTRGTASRVATQISPKPASVPTVCEMPGCGARLDAQWQRCYTCRRVMCASHATRVRTGPPGHRESDPYCPDHVDAAEDQGMRDSFLRIDEYGDWA